MDTINISNLHQCFDRAYLTRKYRKGNDFHALFTFFNYYIQFFILLTSSLSRFAELTYLLYEYSPKMETLLRMEDQANFVIIKEI